MRQNLDFHENFSIGLIYHALDGRKIHLLRMNGNHGETVENPLRPSPHFGYHIHKITPEEIADGAYYEPKFSQLTNKYESFDQAIYYFLKYVNIVDYSSYFKNTDQLSIFD